jgi:hypothetical protein
MVTTSTLIDLAGQSNSLNANFLNTAYGISWLGQKLPQFTTEQFALLPFAPKNSSSILAGSQSWMTIADAYSTNLTCKPANVFPGPLGYTFDNGKGCSVSQINFPNTPTIADYVVQYIGYYDNAQVDWALQNPNCSVEFSNTFLAVWASGASKTETGSYNNMTALFCETSYQTTRIYAEVNSTTTRQISSSTPLGGTGTRLEDIFNITNFEYILATGVTPTSRRANLPDDSVLEQFPRIRDYKIAWPVTNMVGFAVALGPTTVEGLVNPATLQESFERSHRLLFTTAFSQLTINSSNSSQDMRAGVRHDTIAAIVMVRSISIIVEITLGIISMFAGCLWYVSYRHRSNLTKDPASIADVMAIVGSSMTLKQNFQRLRHDGTLTEEQLSEELASQSYFLDKSYCEYEESFLRASKSIPEDDCESSTCVESGSIRSSNVEFVPVRPLELRLSVGATLVGVLIFSLAVLTFLEVFTAKRNGMTAPRKKLFS